MVAPCLNNAQTHHSHDSRMFRTSVVVYTVIKICLLAQSVLDFGTRCPRDYLAVPAMTPKRRDTIHIVGSFLTVQKFDNQQIKRNLAPNLVGHLVHTSLVCTQLEICFSLLERGDSMAADA